MPSVTEAETLHSYSVYLTVVWMPSITLESEAILDWRLLFDAFFETSQLHDLAFLFCFIIIIKIKINSSSHIVEKFELQRQ